MPKALADQAKEEIDKAGTDAEVKQLQEEAEGEIEKSVPVGRRQAKCS